SAESISGTCVLAESGSKARGLKPSRSPPNDGAPAGSGANMRRRIYKPDARNTDATVKNGSHGKPGNMPTKYTSRAENRSIPGCAKSCDPRSELKLVSLPDDTLVTTIPAQIEIIIAGI